MDPIIILWMCAGALILLAVLAVVSAFIMMNTIMKAKKLNYRDIYDWDTSFARGLPEYETEMDRRPFTLPVEDAEISGEVIVNPHPEGKVPKVAIICHGHTAQRASDLKYGWMFYEMGYHLIIFDQRYFGASTGKYCTLGMYEQKDVAALVAYARQQFGGNAFIGLHGESMGAASALLSLRWETPAFVVADCPFAKSKNLLRRLGMRYVWYIIYPALPIGRLIGRLRCGYDFMKVNPVEAVKETDVPICLIHGEEDTYIPPTHSKVMYSFCKNPLSELHLVPGAEHAMSICEDYEGYARILREFVRKVEAADGKV